MPIIYISQQKWHIYRCFGGEWLKHILKDGKNYVCLTDLAEAGFDVGYTAETKTPSLHNKVKDTEVEVDGQIKTIKSVNIDGYNYCMLRGVAEILGNIAIEYNERPSIIRLNKEENQNATGEHKYD